MPKLPPAPTTTPALAREIVSGRPVFWYNASPPPIILEGFPIVQKGRTFYVVKARALDLDRLCRVPVLPYDQDNSDIAAWILSAQADQWQRGLDGGRVDIIADFFRSAANFLVNSATISVPVPPTRIAVSQGSATLTVPVTWAVTRCPACGFVPPTGGPRAGWQFDACPQCDWEGRPGEIVDGQHRIRGATTAGNPHWGEQIVATVLTADQFATGDMAKIFTEITTSAVDLHELHKLCLLYKFRLRARNIGQLGDADFRIVPPTPPARNNLGLRNRRAYEVVSHLCSLRNSRWHDRVTMLPPGSGRVRRGDVIDADRMVSYVEVWFRDGNILSDVRQPDGMLPVNVAVQYLQDFLEAGLSVWPQGTGTPSGSSTWFWNLSRAANGVLQQRGIFEVFLQLFPVLTKRIASIFAQPDRQTYKEQFLYVENVDWNDPAWYDLGTPDKNKNMLLRILAHIYDNAPNPVGPNRLQPWVNSWIKGQPDLVQFVATPASSLPVANASSATPLKFKWESVSGITGARLPKPINAYEVASILVTQVNAGRQEVLLQDTTGGDDYVLDAPPQGLNTGQRASNVEFTIVYTKGNLIRSVSHSHPAV
jgi:hypothetical protein